ncbi:MAG: PA14 domain-containing protein [Armatimonadetes bacterium]|nr:PA14 domain-containing protein [Armatimonadota bacterium]
MIQYSTVLLVLASLCIANIAQCSASNEIRIGNYHAGEVNGISFIYGDDAAFLVRVGWVQADKYLVSYPDYEKAVTRFETCAPDGSFCLCVWKSGDATIRMEWGKSGKDSIICRMTSDAPARITLESAPCWKTFTSNYSVTKAGISGINKTTGKRPISWKLEASREPVAAVCNSNPEEIGKLIADGQTSTEPDGSNAALIYDISPNKPLYFTAGAGKLAKFTTIDAQLDKAKKAYLSKKTAATGDWQDFIEPIINNLNNSKVYGYETKRIAHVVTRSWCFPDGQVLFEWDSFFNGLLASFDDPQGGKDTVRAILANLQPNGLLPSMNNPGSSSIDRSQPPVGAMCVWKMVQRYPDKAFLAEVYPKLVKWHDWWFAKRPSDGLPYRDGNQNGLLEWGSETGGLQEAKWESGLDDSPMYDDCKMVGCSMNLDDVGLSGMWAMDAEYLAIIADFLGKPKDAIRFRAEHKAMGERINTLLWNEELGMYCNRYWEPQTQYEVIAPQFFGKNGLKGEYFSDKEFKTLQRTQNDPQISFFWAAAPGETSFSMRWTGKLTTTATGPHKFMVTAADGVKLWIDGKLVMDHMFGWWRRLESEPIELEAGKEYDIKMEHTRRDTGWECRLFWQGPSINTKPGIFSPRISPTNFYPLISGIPDKDRANRMLNMLTDTNKFWGEYVMPSISIDDPTYPRQHYWRGKIWSPTNYLVYQGLKRCATAKLRMDFAKKGLNLFMKNWTERGTCQENFYCSGKGGSVPHYTWGSLLCLIAVEEICDIEPDGRIRLNGEYKANLGIERIPLFGKLYDVKIKDGAAELLRNGKTTIKANGTISTKTL